MTEYDTIKEKIKGIEKLQDERHDQDRSDHEEINGKLHGIFSEINKLRTVDMVEIRTLAMTRLPPWITFLIGFLTFLVGSASTLAYYAAKLGG